MNDQEMTAASLERLRRKQNATTAAIRERLAEDPRPRVEYELIGTLIVTNVTGGLLASAGVAALAVFDLAKAQAEIVRLQAELDGERAAHSVCHDNVLRAARGDSQ